MALFITIEGGEGAGKSTLIQHIAAQCKAQQIPIITTREPGGIAIAEKIREVILNPEHTAMDARTEALLYAAARRQHLVQKIEPSLQQGVHVICDRFIDSSLAYQGVARNLGMDEIYEINKFAIEGRMPDITFYLDISPEIGLERIYRSRTSSGELNRLDLEKIDFHNKVRSGYLALVTKFPERIIKINAEQGPEQIVAEVMGALQSKLNKGVE